MISPISSAMHLAVLTVLLAACGQDAGERPARRPDAAADTDSVARRDGSPSRKDTTRKTEPRPRTRRDTIRIEGSRESIELALYDATVFSTYYPAGEMKVDQSASDEGLAVRFSAAFGGVLNQEAFLHIFIPNDVRTDYRAMRDFLVRPDGLARSNGWTLGTSRADGPPPCGGAIESWPIARGSGRERSIGFACIGEYRGRGFIVISVYPEEYEEGMGPRVAKILSEFRWGDGGRLWGKGM